MSAKKEHGEKTKKTTEESFIKELKNSGVEVKKINNKIKATAKEGFNIVILEIRNRKTAVIAVASSIIRPDRFDYALFPDKECGVYNSQELEFIPA